MTAADVQQASRQEASQTEIVIPLTQGKVTVIDAEDAYLARYNWHAVRRGDRWYAEATDGTRAMRLHRLIMLCPEARIDHIDGNGLNNRRSNLRVADASSNAQNARLYSTNTSGYKGVHRHNGKWCASIRHQGKRYALGHFPTALEAARAYDAKAAELFGTSAWMNLRSTGA